MRYIYVGAFPPPYGGVTIKNSNLYQALSEKVPIIKVDLREIKKNPFLLIKLFVTLTDMNNRFVIGIAGKKNRKIISGIMYWFNRQRMNQSILIVMGGTASNDMAKDKIYGKYVREYKNIYVETKGMKKTLLDAGITNVEIYPNGRFRPKKLIVSNTSDRLKCVFFSMICEKKGCTEILDVARKMNTVEFAFYGEIDKSYEEYFKNRIAELNNADYYGIFNGSPDDVYRELSNYDVLLFPTKYTIEGVPGILVEAKISGITIIASNASYNRELVQDGENGFILEHNTVESLVEKIDNYNRNRDLLGKHKLNSLNSANYYFIDNYIPKIIADMEG